MPETILVVAEQREGKLNRVSYETVAGAQAIAAEMGWQVEAAILGSGVQAHSHVEALRLVRNFEEIRVWSPTRERAERFAKEIGAKATSAEEAVHSADVIVTATNSKTPVLKGTWLKAGCHVNAIGACRPDWRELDDEAMSNVVFVDSREGALKESGDVILSGAKIYAELGEALAGKAPPRANEMTIFKSLGMAAEDIAAAMLVYRSVISAASRQLIRD